jgi:putative hemolysin
MEDPLTALLTAGLLLAISGFLALIENALLLARKPRLRAKAEEGNKKYRNALDAAEMPGPSLAALRMGIIFLDILAGALGGIQGAQLIWARLPAADHLSGSGAVYPALGALITAAAFTILAVILRDALAKQAAQGVPEKILVLTLPLIRCLGILWTPLITLSSGLAAWILRIFRLGAQIEQGITEDELRMALREGEKSGIVESEERTMVEGVFYLGDRQVGTFMTHRSEVQWLDSNADGAKVRSMAVEFRNQRYFPVADGTLDQVIGVVSVQDIFLAFLENTWGGLKTITRPPHFVPETMSSLKAFEAFKRGEADFLFVIDEYGGFAGVLSIRNLIEEIVGELSASAEEENAILAQDDGSYLVDGSVNIDEIAEILPVAGLPEDQQKYHTLAGFILELAGEIPRTGAAFEWSGYRFKIVDMDGNRIDKILIEKVQGEG